jgi:hypothetical protein
MTAFLETLISYALKWKPSILLFNSFAYSPVHDCRSFPYLQYLWVASRNKPNHDCSQLHIFARSCLGKASHCGKAISTRQTYYTGRLWIQKDIWSTLRWYFPNKPTHSQRPTNISLWPSRPVTRGMPLHLCLGPLWLRVSCCLLRRKSSWWCLHSF